jgi:hypothetical protein
MNISDQTKNLITEEIHYVANAMRECDSLVEKIYLFSGVPGMINRAFNIEFDPELVFLNFVLKSTHEAFIGRLAAINQTGDPTVQVFPWQFDSLSSLLLELKNRIEKNEDFLDILKDFVLLSYLTTGNGYYLYKKGEITFSSNSSVA